jgi:hypothetical protein
VDEAPGGPTDSACVALKQPALTIRRSTLLRSTNGCAYSHGIQTMVAGQSTGNEAKDNRFERDVNRKTPDPVFDSFSGRKPLPQKR